jgi:hypothetical protein
MVAHRDHTWQHYVCSIYAFEQSALHEGWSNIKMAENASS